MIEGGALLLALGLYFWFVFGYLSRRFERQADVYGSKVVSCDMADCPPHTDLDNELAPEPAAARQPSLCPVGIRIFADALDECRPVQRARPQEPLVAARIDRQPDRVPRGLERHPEREHDFQRGVRRLRLGLGFILLAAVVISAVEPDLGSLSPELAFRYSASFVILTPLHGTVGQARPTWDSPTTWRSSCSDGQFASS